MPVYKMRAGTHFYPTSDQYQFLCGVKRKTKAARRMEKGFQYMEGKGMGHADVESLFCLEKTFEEKSKTCQNSLWGRKSIRFGPVG